MRAQVGFGDEGVVDDGEGVDAGEDEVLGYFVGERFHGYEEDVGASDLLLCLNSPEADLAIVEGDLILVVLVDGMNSVKRTLPALMPGTAGAGGSSIAVMIWSGGKGFAKRLSILAFRLFVCSIVDVELCSAWGTEPQSLCGPH